MPYKIVAEHDDGVTLRDIAAAAGVDFSRGLGYYELIKKEKVSAAKQLVLWCNGKVVSDDSADVRRRCGLKVNADNDIKPEVIPANHKLFVQSTSPNRKIPEDAAALFVVDTLEEAEEEGEVEEDQDDEGGPRKRRKTGAMDYALDMDGLFELLDGKDEDELMDFEEETLQDLFRQPIGTMFSGCDERVPQEAQASALRWLSLLFCAEWDEASIVIEINRETNEISKARAEGTVVTHSAEDKYSDSYEGIPVSIYFTCGIPLFAVSIGDKWAGLIGSPGEHPLVWSTDVVYDNSDGSSNQDYPKALPAAARKVDQLNALFAYNIKWFLSHCSDCNH